MPDTRLRSLPLVVLALVLASTEVRADCEPGWGAESVGLHGGGETASGPDYRLIEALLSFKTPARFGSDDGFCLALDAQAGVGALWVEGDGEFIGGIGPRLRFSHGIGVYIEAGIRPVILSGHHFDGDDLGGMFQFTTHFGAGFEIENVRFGFRGQHTSNADIYSNNAGFDIVGAQLELGF